MAFSRNESVVNTIRTKLQWNKSLQNSGSRRGQDPFLNVSFLKRICDCFQQIYFQVAKVLVDRSSDINIYDCLLLAISNESTEIAEGILEHSRWPTVQANCQGHLAPLNHKSSYPPDMTPLIMAAHRNCFSIVKQLLDMGETIEKPHSPTYEC